MLDDRRRHARSSPDAGYFLTCTASGVPRPINLSTRLIDVGPGGACILSVGRLRPSSEIDLSIVLPDYLSRFKARAVVAWSKTVMSTDGRREAHAAGLRFELVESASGRATDFIGAETRGSGRTPEPQRRDKRFSPGPACLSLVPASFWRKRDVALRLVDLSLGGAQVVCSRRLEPGTTAALGVEVSRPWVRFGGEVLVRWCRRDTLRLEPAWHAGLVFKKLDAGGEAALGSLDRAFLG